MAFKFSRVDTYDHDGMCLCTLRELAESGMDLIEVVLVYMGLVEAYEDKVKKLSTRADGSDVGKGCASSAGRSRGSEDRLGVVRMCGEQDG